MNFGKNHHHHHHIYSPQNTISTSIQESRGRLPERHKHPSMLAALTTKIVSQLSTKCATKGWLETASFTCWFRAVDYYIKLSYVRFWAHVKIACRPIVSYRMMISSASGGSVSQSRRWSRVVIGEQQQNRWNDDNSDNDRTAVSVVFVTRPWMTDSPRKHRPLLSLRLSVRPSVRLSVCLLQSP